MTEREIFEKLLAKEITQAQAKQLLTGISDNAVLVRHDDEMKNNNSFSSIDVTTRLKKILCNILHVSNDELDNNTSFSDMGIDSINGVEIVRDINQEFLISIGTETLYDYFCIKKLSEYIAELLGKSNGKNLFQTTHPKEKVSFVKESSDHANNVRSELIRIIGALLHVSPDEYDCHMVFSDMGIDSINGVEIVRDINRCLGTSIDTSALYDYPTTDKLSKYIAELLNKSGANQLNESKLEAVKLPRNPGVDEKQLTKKTLHTKKERTVRNDKRTDKGQMTLKSTVHDDVQASENLSDNISDSDIAIIGMSLKYPGADNADQFWNILYNEKCSTTEIPSSRWKCSDENSSRYGGFINDIDCFDASFFGITPMEAEFMDPQNRIFLQEAYHAIEDAGYSSEQLSNHCCGVFVGAAQGDYSQELNRAGAGKNMFVFTGLNTFMLTGRVSYHMNLTGPCIAFNTACSSAVVAIANACQSLKAGECDFALAGGIKLLLEADTHEQTSKLNLLSPTGQMRSFDTNADGMVLSEGSGVLLLRQLRDAIRDNDSIYGVIKAWGVNHDGKTNGITAPSTPSQIRLLKQTYRRFGINPDDISYVEANGTASKTGDVMELNSLKEIFGGTDRKTECAVGTCKTCIGHSMMASGVAGVAKVVLSMKHDWLPAMPTFSKINERAQLENTPLRLLDKGRAWKKIGDKPRYAAVSSFGLSGTNGHLVIADPPIKKTEKNYGNEKNVFVLSAATSKSLNACMMNLREWLENVSYDMNSIAYTLLMGRNRLKNRIAFIAETKNELILLLDSALGGDYDKKGIYTADKRDIKANDLYERIAIDYIKAENCDFSALYTDKNCSRLHMPVYPFEKTHCWITSQSDSNTNSLDEGICLTNTSTLAEQSYSTLLTGKEFFLTDHIIKRQQILPGVVYLEIATKASSAALERKVCRLRDVFWSLPISVFDEPQTVTTRLYPDDTYIAVEISQSKENINFSCKVDEEDAIDKEREFSVEEILQKCKRKIEGSEFYGTLSKDTVYFGSGFQTIKEVYIDRKEAISVIKLPEQHEESVNSWRLHPAILDSAVETMTSLQKEFNSAVCEPLSVDSFTIYSDVSSAKYAYAECIDSEHGNNDGIRHYNMYLLDNTGHVLAAFERFTIKEL